MDALAVVELSSIARGVIAADAMAKRAPISILQTHPISPGKHLVVIAGGVAEVEEALAAGVAVAGGTLVDRLMLPQAHASLVPLIGGKASVPATLDSVAIFETFTVCSTVVAADAAAKAARVELVDLRLGSGIGGKAFFTMSGRLEEVEAAALAGRNAVETGLLVGIETIAAPHEDLRRRLFW